MHELSWSWITLELIVPPIVGLLIAWPLWRNKQFILGNIAGSAFIFAFAIGLIFREYAQIDRMTKQCIEDGYVCWPEPSSFMRFAIYASIALVQVLALFYLSLRAEDRNRRRDYAPEWR